MTEQKAEKTEVCYQFLIYKMYAEGGGGHDRTHCQPLNSVVFENGLVLLSLTNWEGDPTVSPDVGCWFL